MAIFFSILYKGITCLFYGFIITGFIMATLYFLLSTLSRGAVRSIPFFLTGPILALLLVVNMTVLTGAFTVKSETESMRLWLTQQLDGAEGIANLQISQEVGEMLNRQFPLSECFLNLFDMSGHTVSELPQVFYEVINSEMNRTVWNKILWSLGFIIAAVLVALYFDRGMGNGNKKRPNKQRTITHRNFDDF